MAKLASGELDSVPGALHREAAAAFKEAAREKKLLAKDMECESHRHNHNGYVYKNYSESAEMIPASDLKKSPREYRALSRKSFQEAAEYWDMAAKTRKEARHDRRQYYKHTIMGVVETVAAKLGLSLS